MSDIALIWDAVEGAADIIIVNDDIAADDGLETSVLLSLFLDRRAEVEDELPTDGDRRGWWADEFAEVEGDHEGSRLWEVLERAKIEPGIEARVEDPVRESLAWMIEDGIIETLGVDVVVEGETLSFTVLITRPQDTQNYTWGFLWDGESLNAL